MRVVFLRTAGTRWVDHLSARSLLRICLAPATLNSTIRLETIAWGIPTFALGEALYGRPSLATAIGAREGDRLREALDAERRPGARTAAGA